MKHRKILKTGKFDITQDDGWCFLQGTTPDISQSPGYGYGMIGYTWEENGPSLAVRNGRETLKESIDKMARLPFVDVLYMRCDWRDVQSESGKLDLNPVWDLTFEAAEKYNKRVGFRVQLSSPNFQPDKLSIPDFLKPKIPLLSIGSDSSGKFEYMEPDYSHDEFKKAFIDLNELLVSRFNNDEMVEFVDLMMFGFWGEGHTWMHQNPFNNFHEAESTMVKLTEIQLDLWDKVPLVVNVQPDISNAGNDAVYDLAVNNDCWIRTDSILIEEPQQVYQLSNRPSWQPAIIEDGYNRHFDINGKYFSVDNFGENNIESAMYHAADAGANYWALWTEADEMNRYFEKNKEAFGSLRSKLGYRIRPSWIWQRKRHEAIELVIAFVNDGISGIPGYLNVQIESPDGSISVNGCLEKGLPSPGEVVQASFLLPQGLSGKIVKLKAEIEGVKRFRAPLRWACKQAVDNGRSIDIRLKKSGEDGWRKGI